MIVVNWKGRQKGMTSFPYRGEQLPVNQVAVRWLSDVGLDDSGTAEYGLRYFTVGRGGDIPIHKHFYAQTMYFLEGVFEVTSFAEEDDRVLATRTVGPGDSVFVASMEPHAMRNTGNTDGAFLCCICNVYQDENAL